MEEVCFGSSHAYSFQSAIIIGLKDSNACSRSSHGLGSGSILIEHVSKPSIDASARTFGFDIRRRLQESFAKRWFAESSLHPALGFIRSNKRSQESPHLLRHFVPGLGQI